MSDKKSATYESALGWGILLCVFIALGYLVWYHMQVEIQNAIRWVRYSEMWLTSFFLDKDYAVMWRGQPVNHEAMTEMARTIPAENIDSDFLSALGTVAMTPLVWVVSLISILMGLWALFYGPGSEHRRSFDINSLIKKQANIFPIIAPFIDFNPNKMAPRAPGAPVPADMPIFAEALSPEEWVVFNEIPVVGKKLDEEAVTKAFQKQLGPRWRGSKNLAPYKQVLLAAFCLKAARKRADADTMLGRLAHCWSEKGGLKVSRDRSLLREARAVLGNAAISASVLKKCNEHAWETTAMMRGLVTAREEGGVLAPAQFVWLRAHDRDLWYPLNNLGRQSLHAEALGSMAHYKAEKLAQRPIPRPKVQDAVKSVSEYIASTTARALPQIDYSNSKKRGIKKLKTT